MSNVTRLKPVYYPTLEQRVEDYRTLDRELKAMEKTAERLKQNIIEEMGTNEIVFNTLGHAIATYTTQYATRFNKDDFITSNPGLYEQYEYKKEMKVFRLK